MDAEVLVEVLVEAVADKPVPFVIMDRVMGVQVVAAAARAAAAAEGVFSAVRRPPPPLPPPRSLDRPGARGRVHRLRGEPGVHQAKLKVEG